MAESTQKPKLMVQNISCILPQQSNLGALFLGNVYGAQNAVILKEYGIRAVLTSSIETDISYSFQDVPFHMKIEAHDKENYNIKEHINKCIDFIEKARELTNVYVHCFAGVSRSAAIVCAYIMWKLKWNYETTIAFVKAKRIVAKPNEGFVKQLLEIEDIIIGQGLNLSSENLTIENSHPSVYPQHNTNSIAPKPQIQHKIARKISQPLQNQNHVHHRASNSSNGVAYNDKSLQINTQNHKKTDQSKLTFNAIQNSTYVTDRYQKTNNSTTPTNYHAYQSVKPGTEKVQKTDRFLYLQNFFPQNHSQKTPEIDSKLSLNNQKVVQQVQKPKHNVRLNSTGQNWMSTQNDQLYSTASTQFYRTVQNPQHNSSTKNLMNHNQTQKGVGSTSQLVLGGSKKPTYTHNSTPVPKVLEKKEHQKSNHHLTRVSQMISQPGNQTFQQSQHRLSQGVEIMPKVNEYMWTGSGQQKFSIRNMLSEEHLKSPVNSSKKFDFRSSVPTNQFSNNKSISQQKQTQKTASRLLVRPMDLPGYKKN